MKPTASNNSIAPLRLSSWTPADSRGANAAAAAGVDILCFHPEIRFYRVTIDVPADGTLVANLASPRPLRLSANGVPMLDEAISWRSFQRQFIGAIVLGVQKGPLELLIEVGPRPRHPGFIDRDCPSRNRENLLKRLGERFADRLDLSATLHMGVNAPALAIRFEPSQFRRDGVVYQHVLARPLQHRFEPPATDYAHPSERPDPPLSLSSNVLPHRAVEITADADLRAGLRRFAVPVAEPQNMPAPLRQEGPDNRLEPSVEVARWLELRVDSPVDVTIPLPGFETLGRLAPRREYRELAWPTLEELMSAVPEPILPPALGHYRKLYRAAWEMFLQLLRFPGKESGVVNSYISTGSGFGLKQYVWDSSFTTMVAAYGWRKLSIHAQLDNLYSRQFDGGYIHREYNWATGMPELFEPDFSPNPPLMSLAEWQIARLTGDRLRLREVYPVLKVNHQWLCHNRRLPDGTFWTTGLANGLDNSPSLGLGYPDLSAQMAHDAEILAQIAALIGNEEDARTFEAQQRDFAQAINRHLWSQSMRIYATSLPDGGHNPHKIVTAFWPLWAGVVPPERVEALADHLLDPASFWRHHPIPSLAADSPQFSPHGDYWLGSTWAPTNYAAIKGFARCGRHDLALATTMRHLECMAEVLENTGYIWENYCCERSEPGNCAGKPHCWSALGPIALLLEIVLGLEADALRNSLTWTLPEGDGIGVRNFPLGHNTLTLIQHLTDGTRQLLVQAEFPFTLYVRLAGNTHTFGCGAGKTILRL